MQVETTDLREAEPFLWLADDMGVSVELRRYTNTDDRDLFVNLREFDAPERLTVFLLACMQLRDRGSIEKMGALGNEADSAAKAALSARPRP